MNLTSLLLAIALFVGPADAEIQPVDEVDEVVVALASQPRFTSRAVGYSGTESEAFALFVRLRRSADDAELGDLLRHTSGVVRLYAFRALIERGGDADTLTRMLANGDEPVDTQYGCRVGRSTVAAVAKTIVDWHTPRAADE
jgi:hypothetical protein